MRDDSGSDEISPLSIIRRALATSNPHAILMHTPPRYRNRFALKMRDGRCFEITATRMEPDAFASQWNYELARVAVMGGISLEEMKAKTQKYSFEKDDEWSD